MTMPTNLKSIEAQHKNYRAQLSSQQSLAGHGSVACPNYNKLYTHSEYVMYMYAASDVYFNFIPRLQRGVRPTPSNPPPRTPMKWLATWGSRGCLLAVVGLCG